MTIRHSLRKFAAKAGGLAAAAVLAGLLAATLVRLAPGFEADERQMDPRLDEAAQRVAVEERARNRDIAGFYIRYLGGMLRGDLGESIALHRPIGELIRDRLPVTAELMGVGVAGGWALALALAIPATLWRGRAFDMLGGTASGLLLCVPSAAMAVLIFAFGGPVRAIVALVIFPRVFDSLRNVLRDAWGQPHVLAARARGVRTGAILRKHVLPPAAPQLLALAGVSANQAFAATIPAETLCDLPGVGQLAWKAAVARDLPVLVAMTLLIALFTAICNSIADAAARDRAGATA